MKKIISFILGGILWACCISESGAQDNCGGAINNAKTLYEQGKLHDVITELQPCLSHSIDKTNLWQGYKLLAQSYLALNDPANARKAAENMLEVNPLFSPSKLKDTKDFIDLVNSITVIPKFSIGLSFGGGLNNTYPSVDQAYTISDYTKKYTNALGFQFGFFLGYHITKNLEVGVNLYSSTKDYGISYTTNNYNISVNEKLSYLEVPLLVTYNFGKGKIRPFITAGAYEGFLLNATSDFSAQYVDGTGYSDKNIVSTARRQSTNFGVLGGIGVTYKIWPSGHVFLDFRYCYGLTDIVNGTNRYTADENILFKYYYVDDDLKISNSMITLGYVQYINYKVVRK